MQHSLSRRWRHDFLFVETIKIVIMRQVTLPVRVGQRPVVVPLVVTELPCVVKRIALVPARIEVLRLSALAQFGRLVRRLPAFVRG
mmetsp:Transcript_26586/g.35564  ORF Transcript_26586/g.35564 Transcript_26586/m.35564 type:complete len:86 (+) Transcript_26586:187-444(+)